MKLECGGETVSPRGGRMGSSRVDNLWLRYSSVVLRKVHVRCRTGIRDTCNDAARLASAACRGKQSGDLSSAWSGNVSQAPHKGYLIPKDGRGCSCRWSSMGNSEDVARRNNQSGSSTGMKHAGLLAHQHQTSCKPELAWVLPLAYKARLPEERKAWTTCNQGRAWVSQVNKPCSLSEKLLEGLGSRGCLVPR